MQNVRAAHINQTGLCIPILTFTTVWENSADSILIIVFLLFQENDKQTHIKTAPIVHTQYRQAGLSEYL